MPPLKQRRLTIILASTVVLGGTTTYFSSNQALHLRSVCILLPSPGRKRYNKTFLFYMVPMMFLEAFCWQVTAVFNISSSYNCKHRLRSNCHHFYQLAMDLQRVWIKGFKLFEECCCSADDYLSRVVWIIRMQIVMGSFWSCVVLAVALLQKAVIINASLTSANGIP